MAFVESDAGAHETPPVSGDDGLNGVVDANDRSNGASRFAGFNEASVTPSHAGLYLVDFSLTDESGRRI